MLFYGSPFKERQLTITHAQGLEYGVSPYRDPSEVDLRGGKNHEEGHNVHNHDEGAVGSRSTFRPPSKAVESKNEEVHFWGA